MYLKEFSLLKEIKEDFLLSLLIEHSFRTKSVFFEVRSCAGSYVLSWEYEIPWNDCISAMAKYAKPQSSIADALKDPNVIAGVSKLGKAYSCTLLPDEMRLINEIVSNGLPEIDRKKFPVGLDGHSYHLNCPSMGKEYECWAVLPIGWDLLDDLICLFARKANLEISYLPMGMQ